MAYRGMPACHGISWHGQGMLRHDGSAQGGMPTGFDSGSEKPSETTPKSKRKNRWGKVAEQLFQH